jgi:hypothetical protein
MLSQVAYQKGFSFNTYEPAISQHRVHTKLVNHQSAFPHINELYFKNSQYLSCDTFHKNIVPVLQTVSNSYSSELASDALQWAKKTFSNADANTQLISAVIRIIRGPEIRKGPLDAMPFNLIFGQLADRLWKCDTLYLTIPVFPCKMRSPIKSRGNLPCLAEVSTLLRFHEICRAITILLNEFNLTSCRKCEFIVYCDGLLFLDTLHGRTETDAITYRKMLEKWCNVLGIYEFVTIKEYNDLYTTVENNKVDYYFSTIEKHYQIISNRLENLLNTSDISESFHQAKKTIPQKKKISLAVVDFFQFLNQCFFQDSMRR